MARAVAAAVVVHPLLAPCACAACPTGRGPLRRPQPTPLVRRPRAHLPACLPAHHTQGALLTSGYSYLYALALIPAGILADKQNRPRWDILSDMLAQGQAQTHMLKQTWPKQVG